MGRQGAGNHLLPSLDCCKHLTICCRLHAMGKRIVRPHQTRCHPPCLMQRCSFLCLLEGSVLHAVYPPVMHVCRNRLPAHPMHKVLLPAGSPAGPGTGQYPLTIVSDDDEGPADGAPSSGGAGGGGGAKFGRAASLRVALQSWRSIRAALGDRPGSSPSPVTTGSNGAEHDDHAAHQQVCKPSAAPHVLRCGRGRFPGLLGWLSV